MLTSLLLTVDSYLPHMPATFAKNIDSKSRRKLQHIVDARKIYTDSVIIVKQNDHGYNLNGRLGSTTYEGRFLGDNFRAAKIALEKIFG